MFLLTVKTHPVATAVALVEINPVLTVVLVLKKQLTVLEPLTEIGDGNDEI